MTGPEIRRARPADVDALTTLWAEAFMPPLAPDQWLLDERRFDGTFVADDEHGLCGSIYGLRKRLREHDGGVAEVHGIGSVAVAERVRGHGVARRLVATTLAAAGDADWALLFTGTPEVYGSSGFTSFTMQRTLEGAWQHGTADAADDIVDMRPIVPGSLACVRDVYERSRDGGVTLAPVRGSLAWRMAEERLRDMTLLTVGAADAVAGYAVTQVRGTVGVVVESVLTADTAPTLLAAIGAQWRACGVTTCSIAVPALTEERALFTAFAPEARDVVDTTGMVRPLRRPPRLDGIRHFTGADYF